MRKIVFQANKPVTSPSVHETSEMKASEKQNDKKNDRQLKQNSATHVLELNSLRIICVKCGKSRDPNEVACCLKAQALVETQEKSQSYKPSVKASQSVSRTTSMRAVEELID